MSSIHPSTQNIPKPKTSICQKNTYFNWIMTIWGMKCLDPKSDSQNSNFRRPPYPLKILRHFSFNSNIYVIFFSILKKKKKMYTLDSNLIPLNPLLNSQCILLGTETELKSFMTICVATVQKYGLEDYRTPGGCYD
jgi:hypothetical protein